MRILVTGAAGFVGWHLLEALTGDLHGLGRQPDAKLPGGASYHACDLTSHVDTLAVLKSLAPDQIYHLAGYAHAGSSFKEPAEAWRDNLEASRTLYDSIAAWGGKPRILFVSSALIYGEPDASNQAQDEGHPLRPSSPYATSKAAADLLSYQVTRSHGLDVVRARPFNHIGPRQSPQYAVASFARQIAAIEAGRQEPVVQAGSLSPRRDLTDVRDMVRAYVLLMEQGKTGEAYNAGTGTVVSIRELLDCLVAMAKLPVRVQTKEELVRQAEVSIIRANPAKLFACTGWKPTYALEQSLKDTLDWWREQTSDSGSV